MLKNKRHSFAESRATKTLRYSKKFNSVIQTGLSAALSFGVLFSCAHKGEFAKPSAERSRLIPYGVHQQSVTVSIKRGPNGQELPASAPKKMTFSGVMDHRPDRTQLIGLTPFGSTLFKLVDDPKTGSLTFTTENEQMKKAEPYLKSTYQPLRALLKLPYPPKIRETNEGDIQFKFANYNDSEIPLKIEIGTPNFDLIITEENYEP